MKSKTAKTQTEKKGFFRKAGEVIGSIGHEIAEKKDKVVAASHNIIGNTKAAVEEVEKKPVKKAAKKIGQKKTSVVKDKVAKVVKKAAKKTTRKAAKKSVKAKEEN